MVTISTNNLFVFAVYFLLHLRFSDLSNPSSTKNKTTNFHTTANEQPINSDPVLQMELIHFYTLNPTLSYLTRTEYSGNHVFQSNQDQTDYQKSGRTESLISTNANKYKRDTDRRQQSDVNDENKNEEIGLLKTNSDKSGELLTEASVNQRAVVIDNVQQLNKMNSSVPPPTAGSENTLNSTLMEGLCDEIKDENCVIDHTKVCVGDKQYCNLTYDEYMGILYEYITPTPSEWILIVSHAFVFIMGLVSINVTNQFRKLNNNNKIMRIDKK